MKIQDISLFIEVARAGSFSAVARMRDTDPSSISRAIAQFEARTGMRLFERTTRAMRLTEAGETYLRRVSPLLEELERVTTETREDTAQPAGTLRLTASVSFGLERILPVIPLLREKYPDLSLDLRFTDANLDLVSERIDLAIRLAPDVAGDVVRSKLCDTAYYVVASPSYLTSAQELLHPIDLKNHECVLFQLPEHTNTWRFRDANGTMIEQSVSGRICLSPAHAVRDACSAGLGPALLANWLIDKQLKDGTLVKCLTSWQVTATQFETAAWLVYPSRRFLPKKVRCAIDFFRETLG